MTSVPTTGMRPRPSPIMSTLDPILRGVTASAFGTLAMDASLYRGYRRDGGNADFPGWESSEGLVSWEDAPAPALRPNGCSRSCSSTRLRRGTRGS